MTTVKLGIEDELSCAEAWLILRDIPLRKEVSKMTEEEKTSVNHYIFCKDCRDLGLAGILNAKLSCQEAILVWAECASALWIKCSSMLGPRIETLIELYAAEHVWGKYRWSPLACGWDPFTGCHERPCEQLCNYWMGVPMSSSAGDGARGVICLFPFLFKLFSKEEWPLDKLTEIQTKRMACLVRDIKSDTITVSIGHYHSKSELEAELQEHLEIRRSHIYS